jgi:hypothetical protein
MLLVITKDCMACHPINKVADATLSLTVTMKSVRDEFLKFLPPPIIQRLNHQRIINATGLAPEHTTDL